MKERRRFIGFFLLATLPLNLFISLSLADIMGFPLGILMGALPIIQTGFTFEFIKKVDNEKKYKEEIK